MLFKRAYTHIKQRQLQAGLSLLEMVVAMAILGISLGVLYQAVGGASRNVQTSERYAYAIAIAESLLAENTLVPDSGLELSGETGGDYRWVLTASPLPNEDEQQPIPLLSMHIAVTWGEARPGRFELDSIVAGVPAQ